MNKIIFFSIILARTTTLQLIPKNLNKFQSCKPLILSSRVKKECSLSEHFHLTLAVVSHIRCRVKMPANNNNRIVLHKEFSVCAYLMWHLIWGWIQGQIKIVGKLFHSARFSSPILQAYCLKIWALHGSGTKSKLKATERRHVYYSQRFII